MTRADRARLVHELQAIAAQHGARCTVRTEGRGTTALLCAFPEVHVSLDVGGPLAPGILAHWHDAARPLQGPHLGTINPHHRRKATLWGADAAAFTRLWSAACAAVAAGAVFEEPACAR